MTTSFTQQHYSTPEPLMHMSFHSEQSCGINMPANATSASDLDFTGAQDRGRVSTPALRLHVFLQKVTQGAPNHTLHVGSHHCRPTSNHVIRKRWIPQQFEGTRNTTFFSHWLFVLGQVPQGVMMQEGLLQNCVQHRQQMQWEGANILWLESDSF